MNVNSESKKTHHRLNKLEVLGSDFVIWALGVMILKSVLLVGSYPAIWVYADRWRGVRFK